MRKLLKIVSAIMCIAIMLSLSACGKSEEVVAVEKLISEIGDVSFDSEKAIEEAEWAFNALSAEDKEKVSNYDDLTKAKETYASLVASVEGALCSYIVNQPERNGCVFDTLSVDAITVNDEAITVTGVVTFYSDKSYTCKFTSVVSETSDSSSTVTVESWEDNFDAVYKSAQPVHWEVDYYLDDFGDPTNDSYIRGGFEGTFMDSSGNGNLEAYVYIDCHNPWAVSFRMFKYGNYRVNPSYYDADDITIKIKIDGKVYEDTATIVSETNIYISESTELFKQIIKALEAGKEITCVIEINETRYSTSTYKFTIDSFGISDISHNW